MIMDATYCLFPPLPTCPCNNRSSNKEDAAFDDLIGHIQDILLGKESELFDLGMLQDSVLFHEYIHTVLHLL